MSDDSPFDIEDVGFIKFDLLGAEPKHVPVQDYHQTQAAAYALASSSAQVGMVIEDLKRKAVAEAQRRLAYEDVSHEARAWLASCVLADYAKRVGRLSPMLEARR